MCGWWEGMLRSTGKDHQFDGCGRWSRRCHQTRGISVEVAAAPKNWNTLAALAAMENVCAVGSCSSVHERIRFVVPRFLRPVKEAADHIRRTTMGRLLRPALSLPSHENGSTLFTGRERWVPTSVQSPLPGPFCHLPLNGTLVASKPAQAKPPPQKPLPISPSLCGT